MWILKRIVGEIAETMVEILENETISKKKMITHANMIQTDYVYKSMDSSLDELLSQFYKKILERIDIFSV